MPLHTFGVSCQDVLDSLPTDTVNVSSNSRGLNTQQIEGFISRASGQVAAILTRHGIAPESLGDDEVELVRDAIISYSGGYSLERLGASQDQITRRFDEWKRITEDLKSTPQNLGEAQNAQSARQVRSNLSPDNPSKRAWNSRNYSGW